MKQYFINRRNVQEGPYRLEELQQKGLTEDTLVWFAGSKGWKRASMIEELEPYVQRTSVVDTSMLSSEVALDNESDESSAWIIKAFSILVIMMIVYQMITAVSDLPMK